MNLDKINLNEFYDRELQPLIRSLQESGTTFRENGKQFIHNISYANIILSSFFILDGKMTDLEVKHYSRSSQLPNPGEQVTVNFILDLFLKQQYWNFYDKDQPLEPEQLIFSDYFMRIMKGACDYYNRPLFKLSEAIERLEKFESLLTEFSPTHTYSSVIPQSSDSDPSFSHGSSSSSSSGPSLSSGSSSGFSSSSSGSSPTLSSYATTKNLPITSTSKNSTPSDGKDLNLDKLKLSAFYNTELQPLISSLEGWKWTSLKPVIGHLIHNIIYARHILSNFFNEGEEVTNFQVLKYYLLFSRLPIPGEQVTMNFILNLFLENQYWYYADKNFKAEKLTFSAYFKRIMEKIYTYDEKPSFDLTEAIKILERFELLLKEFSPTPDSSVIPQSSDSAPSFSSSSGPSLSSASSSSFSSSSSNPSLSSVPSSGFSGSSSSSSLSSASSSGFSSSSSTPSLSSVPSSGFSGSSSSSSLSSASSSGFSSSSSTLSSYVLPKAYSITSTPKISTSSEGKEWRPIAPDSLGFLYKILKFQGHGLTLDKLNNRGQKPNLLLETLKLLKINLLEPCHIPEGRGNSSIQNWQWLFQEEGFGFKLRVDDENFLKINNIIDLSQTLTPLLTPILTPLEEYLKSNSPQTRKNVIIKLLNKIKMTNFCDEKSIDSLLKDIPLAAKAPSDSILDTSTSFINMLSGIQSKINAIKKLVIKEAPLINELLIGNYKSGSSPEF